MVELITHNDLGMKKQKGDEIEEAFLQNIANTLFNSVHSKVHIPSVAGGRGAIGTGIRGQTQEVPEAPFRFLMLHTDNL